eukprot:jgi/Picsp_1/4592/NSC_01962-R1_---NA---
MLISFTHQSSEKKNLKLLIDSRGLISSTSATCIQNVRTRGEVCTRVLAVKKALRPQIRDMGLVKTLIGVLVDEIGGKDKGPPPSESSTGRRTDEKAAVNNNAVPVPPVGGNPDAMLGAHVLVRGQSAPVVLAPAGVAPGVVQPSAAACPNAPGVAYPAASYAQPPVYYPRPGGNGVHMSARETRKAEKQRKRDEKRAERERRKAEKEDRRKEDIETIVRGIKNIF